MLQKAPFCLTRSERWRPRLDRAVDGVIAFHEGSVEKVHRGLEETLQRENTREDDWHRLLRQV